MQLEERCLNRLRPVHPKLSDVVKRAAEITEVPFIITEGLRTLERQKQLLAAKATKTLNSKHLTGHAVDLAAKIDGEVRWDWPLYDQISKAMKKAAAELNVKITWGGDWKTFKDGPHFEIDPKTYPMPVHRSK